MVDVKIGIKDSMCVDVDGEIVCFNGRSLVEAMSFYNSCKSVSLLDVLKKVYGLK